MGTRRDDQFRRDDRSHGVAGGSYRRAAMAAARRFHTATLLPNRKVLMAGGDSGGGPLASAEVYDPADRGSFSAHRQHVGAAARAHSDVICRTERF